MLARTLLLIHLASPQWQPTCITSTQVEVRRRRRSNAKRVQTLVSLHAHLCSAAVPMRCNPAEPRVTSPRLQANLCSSWYSRRPLQLVASCSFCLFVMLSASALFRRLMNGQGGLLLGRGPQSAARTSVTACDHCML